MVRAKLRATTAAVILVAVSACGGRALVDEGAGAGGQGGSTGTTPQGGGPALASGGSSSTSPGCPGSCGSNECVGGILLTSPGECCPSCVTLTPAVDAGNACNGGACPSLLCTSGVPTTLAGQCCPVCVSETLFDSDAGNSLPPPSDKCLATMPAPSPCPLTAADIACELDSDCVPEVAPASCGATCLMSVYAINQASTAICDPCPADPSCNGQFEYLGQDCRLLLMGQGNFSARCVAGTCTSVAVP